MEITLSDFIQGFALGSAMVLGFALIKLLGSGGKK